MLVTNVRAELDAIGRTGVVRGGQRNVGCFRVVADIAEGLLVVLMLVVFLVVGLLVVLLVVYTVLGREVGRKPNVTAGVVAPLLYLPGLIVVVVELE